VIAAAHHAQAAALEIEAAAKWPPATYRQFLFPLVNVKLSLSKSARAKSRIVNSGATSPYESTLPNVLP
jgi:hypothetical protein